MTSELGDFLRARRTRAALAPSEPSMSRRRATGLRREEVAAAADISVDYYTRLEQGRVEPPSDAVLDALARGLRLSTDERDHLFSLRPQAAHSTAAHSTAADETTSHERLAALVEAVRPNPAYVLDRLSNVIAANPEGLAMYRGFAELPTAHRNTCRYLLTDPRARDRFVEWEEIARGAVAHLRSANAGDLQRPALRALTDDLRAGSVDFETWWTEHLVERRRGSVVHIRTDDGVVVARRYEVLYLPDDGLRMTLWFAA